MTVQQDETQDTLDEKLEDKNFDAEIEILKDEIKKIKKEKTLILEELGEYSGCQASVDEIKKVISAGFNAISLIDEAQRVVDTQKNEQNIKINEYLIYLKNVERKIDEIDKEFTGEIKASNLAIKRLKNKLETIKEADTHRSKIKGVFERIEQRRIPFMFTSWQRLGVMLAIFFATTVTGTLIGITIINLGR